MTPNHRIPDYPPPERALDGSEPLAAWQDGRQRSIPALSLIELALRQLRLENSAGLSAYASWLTLPGNAGKSLADFFEFLRGPPGAQGSGGDFIDLSNTPYRQGGVTYDSDVLARIAMDTGRSTNRVKLPRGKGMGENGRYTFCSFTQNYDGYAGNTGNLFSGLELFGDDQFSSVIEHVQGGYALYYNPPGVNRVELGGGLNGLYVHDLGIYTPQRDFSEHSHQIMLNGVTAVFLERLRLIGGDGDGLHLGQGDVPDQVRFNAGIFGRDLTIEGHKIPGVVGGNNRNAISILAGLVVDIQARIANYTRTGGPGAFDATKPDTGFAMPGGVDIEPNFGGDKLAIGDITLDLTCENVGGGAVAIFLPPQDDAKKVRNIRVTGTAKGCYRGKANIITFGSGNSDYDVFVDMVDDGCERPFEALSGRGFKITGKSYNFRLPALVGYPDGRSWTNLEIDNDFYGGATAGGGALLWRGGDDVRIGGRFIGGDVAITIASPNPLKNSRVTADFVGQSVYPIQAVNFGEGEPVVDWGSVDMTDASFHDRPNSAYVAGSFVRDVAARGTVVGALPLVAALPKAHLLRLAPNDLGGPTEVMTIQASGAGARAVYGVQQRFLPAPIDKTSNFAATVKTTGGVMARGNGRYEALARGLVIETASNSLVNQDEQVLFYFTAPFAAATGSTTWIWNTIGDPVLDQIGYAGIGWDSQAIGPDGVRGQALAVQTASGGNLLYGYLGSFQYNRGFAIYVTRLPNNQVMIRWQRADENGNLVDVMSMNGVTIPAGPLYLRRGAQIESGQSQQFLQ